MVKSFILACSSYFIASHDTRDLVWTPNVNGPRRAGSTVIVLDASAAVDWLLQTSAGQRIEKRIYAHNESLHAPHLLDLEVTQVLRRLVREGAISAQRAEAAVRDLLDLRITRYPHFLLLPEIWRRRNNVSAYD